MSARARRARTLAGAVPDPELPMIGLADLGVLQRVEEVDGAIRVGLIPTHAGCPALGAIRADVVRVLLDAGFDDVEVRIDPEPTWSSDLISPTGREALRRAGVSPPGPTGSGPVLVGLGITRWADHRRDLVCPRCGSVEVEELSEFGPTPCLMLARCLACAEPFEHMKEH